MTDPGLQLTPLFLEVDGVTVELLEVSRQSITETDVWYIVSVKIHYKGITSRTFPLFVKDTRDMVNKLKVEITKVKFIEYVYGLTEVKRLIT